jgi:hypothetical protein
VRLEVAPDRLLVVEDVNLPRGSWRTGDLDLFVAFGAPGAPEAIDARLLSVKDGALEAPAEDAGEAIEIERAPRRPASAQPLLGPASMAGVILHVKEASFRRTTEGGAMAAVRVRTILALPVEDARTGREVVVRLGATAGTPLTLGRVQIASIDPKWLARAEAHLCGADADPWPLAIGIVPRPAPAPPRTPPLPIAPVLSVRHASDDLCVRFWTAVSGATAK